MVYLKGLFARKSTTLLLIAVIVMENVSAARYTYKKPIYGKTNKIKDKQYKFKPEIAIDQTATTVAPSTVPTIDQGEITSTIVEDQEPHLLRIADVIESTTYQISKEENMSSLSPDNIYSTIEANIDETDPQDAETMPTKTTALNPASVTTETIPKAVTLTVIIATDTTRETASSTTATTTKIPLNNQPVPCTCGVFMASQIKQRNSNGQPSGQPVIVNELDRTFTCNAVGQKQCQTKCLETIVQHLPNSANILCATLDRDCRKERAYLFIKNCRNHWINTNLTAGREYCCKNGQPYQCPLV